MFKTKFLNKIKTHSLSNNNFFFENRAVNGIRRHFCTVNGIRRHFCTVNGLRRHFRTVNGIRRHFCTVLVSNQIDAQFFYNTFIYLFKSSTCFEQLCAHS
jgi:hypothetical protein